jgi:hypothetical protein
VKKWSDIIVCPPHVENQSHKQPSLPLQALKGLVVDIPLQELVHYIVFFQKTFQKMSRKNKKTSKLFLKT